MLTIFLQAQNNVEMADALRNDGKIWVVVVVILIILIGLFFYLWRLDNRIKKIENNNSRDT
ncbi:MAG TPA: CcmD family protein [Cyclobacteriaceae bacterium]